MTDDPFDFLVQEGLDAGLSQTEIAAVKGQVEAELLDVLAATFAHYMSERRSDKVAIGMRAMTDQGFTVHDLAAVVLAREARWVRMIAEMTSTSPADVIRRELASHHTTDDMFAYDTILKETE